METQSEYVNLDGNPDAIFALENGQKAILANTKIVLETMKHSNRVFFTTENSKVNAYNRLSIVAKTKGNQARYPDFIKHVRLKFGCNKAVGTRQEFYDAIVAGVGVGFLIS